MLRKVLLECGTCCAQAAIDFETYDEEGGLLTVKHCPFCGDEYDDDTEDEVDEEEEDY